MIVVKEIKKTNTYDIIFQDGDKKLIITYGENYDLYWSLYDKNSTNGIFEILITKENYRIYQIFNELFNRIKNCEVYGVKHLDDDVKKLSNIPFKENKIEWHSDEVPFNDANILKIIECDEDSYLIRLERNEKDIYNRHTVRISNSGSIHRPFNIIFMDMYQKLQQYDMEDKRIHIEEYMYTKKKSVKS